MTGTLWVSWLNEDSNARLANLSSTLCSLQPIGCLKQHWKNKLYRNRTCRKQWKPYRQIKIILSWQVSPDQEELMQEELMNIFKSLEWKCHKTRLYKDVHHKSSHVKDEASVQLFHKALKAKECSTPEPSKGSTFEPLKEQSRAEKTSISQL